MNIEKELIIIAILSIGLVAAYFISRSDERSRTREILAHTPSAYDFSPEDNGRVGDLFGAFKSAQTGGHSRILNVVQNSHTLLFEFYFTIDQITDCINVVVVPATGVPDFILRPEGYLEKSFSLFGYQDFDFEYYPGFSSSYILQGEDEAGVRWFFEERALNYFDSAPGHIIEVKNGHAALMYRGELSPQEYIRLLSHAQQVWSSIV